MSSPHQCEPVQQDDHRPIRCMCICACVCLRVYFFFFLPAVSALPEEGRQQASDHAAATEALQEPDHPGLQDAGPGTHQHGRGNTTRFRNVALGL